MKSALKSVIKMERKDFIKEHKTLIKILKSGNPFKQRLEAAKQQQELDEYAV